MAQANKIPARCEADPAYTWALEDMYPNLDAWQADLEKCRAVAGQAAALQGKLADAAVLLQYCQLEEELGQLLRKLNGYASCKRDEDTANADSQALVARATSGYVECSGMIAFATPEILAISEESLEQFYQQQPGLERYRRSLTDARRMKSHVLSASEEALLAGAS